jgi:hypothetical protein
MGVVVRSTLDPASPRAAGRQGDEAPRSRTCRSINCSRCRPTWTTRSGRRG